MGSTDVGMARIRKVNEEKDCSWRNTDQLFVTGLEGDIEAKRPKRRLAKGSRF